jgi:FkbM family methyltransferase
MGSRWAALLTATAVLALLALQEAPAAPGAGASLLRSAARAPPLPLPPPSPAPPRRLGALQLSAACAYPGIAEDRNLSYPLPAFFPLPALPLVMETMPRACDLCWTRLGEHPNPCELLSSKKTWAPDPHVREALVSALLPCALAPDSAGCNFLDAGANMGVFSLWAWGLGARVVAVEPQPDLAAALRRSVRLNCAGGGGIEVVEGGLTAVEGAAGGGGSPHYRGAPAGAKIQMFAGPTGEANYGYRQCQLPATQEPVIFHTSTEGEAPLVLVDDVLLARQQWALVKVDVDGYDADLLHRMLTLVQRGAVAVDAFIVEMNNCLEERVCSGAVHLAHELG